MLVAKECFLIWIYVVILNPKVVHLWSPQQREVEPVPQIVLAKKVKKKPSPWLQEIYYARVEYTYHMPAISRFETQVEFLQSWLPKTPAGPSSQAHLNCKWLMVAGGARGWVRIDSLPHPSPRTSPY